MRITQKGKAVQQCTPKFGVTPSRPHKTPTDSHAHRLAGTLCERMMGWNKVHYYLLSRECDASTKWMDGWICFSLSSAFV